VGQVIHRAWKLGATFDAWTEHFHYETWLRAFADSGLEPGFYARRQRSPDELLPWNHIDVGLTPAFLEREYRCAIECKNTPDCRFSECSACGLQRWYPECQQKLKRASSAE
jgi:hypothetical protein